MHLDRSSNEAEFRKNISQTYLNEIWITSHNINICQFLKKLCGKISKQSNEILEQRENDWMRVSVIYIYSLPEDFYFLSFALYSIRACTNA